MRSEREGEFLNSLVSDCIVYKLSVQEALLYIQSRFGKSVSAATYMRRKARLQSDKGADNWLRHFTRIGFVKHHRAILDNIKTILDDSNRRLLIEQQRIMPQEFNNNIRQRVKWQRGQANLIVKLKGDIRESANLLSELGLGTPVVAQIRAKLAEKEDKQLETQQRETLV